MDPKVKSALEEIYTDLQWYAINSVLPLTNSSIENFEGTVIKALGRLSSMNGVPGLEYISKLASEAVNNFDGVDSIDAVIGELESLGIGD